MGGDFRIVLSPGVPDRVRLRLAQDVDSSPMDHDQILAEIGQWIIHTGGPKLEAIEEMLLPEGALDLSWECLRKMERRPESGMWSILAAIGPGFCAELVVLQW